LRKPKIERMTPVIIDSPRPNAVPLTIPLVTYSGITMIRNEFPIPSAIRAPANASTRRSTANGAITRSTTLRIDRICVIGPDYSFESKY